MMRPPTRLRVLIMVFPLLQTAAFVASCAAGVSIVGAVFFALAGVLLCFSVHVSIHEAVHQPALARFPLAGPLLSVVMGLPLQGYRWHHLNHHRWNNALADYSTTWRQTPGGPHPWPLWSYVLGWPRQLVRSGLAMRAAYAAGQIPPHVHRATRREQATLLLALAILAVAAPRMAAAYLVLVYGGWALIALQNYGQHPPRQYGEQTPTSYYAPLYNRLLFRNGLHAEHHRQPHLAWTDIEPLPHPPIAVPHLLHPLVERAPR
jgi:fatty acid desaturase